MRMSKSNLDSDSRYYFGGLDLDNQMKCYGEDENVDI